MVEPLVDTNPPGAGTSAEFILDAPAWRHRDAVEPETGAQRPGALSQGAAGKAMDMISGYTKNKKKHRHMPF